MGDYILILSDEGILTLREYGNYQNYERVASKQLSRRAKKEKIKKYLRLLLKSLSPLQTVVSIVSTAVGIVLAVLLFRKQDKVKGIEPTITRIEQKLDSVLNSKPLLQTQPDQQQRQDSSKSN